MRDYAAMAKASGFTDAAVLPVRELVVVPEYRRFCAQNLCGNYGVLPACPPMSGTVEEMTADMRRYQTALILMIETTPVDYWDMAEQKAAKKHQNLLTEQLMEQGGRSDRSSDDGRRPVEARVLYVGLLRGRAEDGRRCSHEMLGGRREDPLLFSDPVSVCLTPCIARLCGSAAACGASSYFTRIFMRASIY